jgi:hypothetical protein
VEVFLAIPIDVFALATARLVASLYHDNIVEHGKEMSFVTTFCISQDGSPAEVAAYPIREYCRPQKKRICHVTNIGTQRVGFEVALILYEGSSETRHM